MLIPTFMTKEGRLIRGAAASLNLPGKSNEDPNDGIIPPMTTSIPTVLPGQMFDARIPPNAEPKSGLRTTTIQVPTNMLMRKGESNDKLAESILQQTQQSVPPSNTNPAYATSVSYQEPNSQFANRQPLSGQPVSGQPGQGVSTISNGKGVFDSALPVMHSSFSTKNANGWALPEFAPATWSVQSPRSAPSQPQAPALQASPQVASPNR